jgi:predicted dehydrogenase
MRSSPLSSSPPLRWGLLSTARINRALIPPLRSSKRNQLVAIASRTLEKAQKYAQEWNIPRAFGSYEAMLADPEIDVIYNSLPNHLHAEWTIKAAQAGKHVLCEKPLALSVEEVDAITSAANEAGVVVTEAFMYRHHPQTLQVKEMVTNGAVGEVWLVHGSFTFKITNENDVRLDPRLGGGSVWDVGCYPISYARFLIGREPEFAIGWQRIGSKGVDESFAGQLRFPGEIYAQFDCGFRTPLRAQIEVIGSTGSISIPNPFKPGKNEKINLSRGETVETFKVPGQELYLGEVEDLADAILIGKQPRVSLADSRANVAAIAALLQSAQESRLVTVEK